MTIFNKAIPIFISVILYVLIFILSRPFLYLMSIPARIKELRNSLAFSQKVFGEKIGVGTSHVSQWERDISLPSGKALIGMAKLGVNINWVLTGDGEMITASSKTQVSKVAFSEEQRLEIERIVREAIKQITETNQ